MAQYTALGLMLEQLTGYEFVEYVHWIQYAHIYVNQLDAGRRDARARAAAAADAAADRGRAGAITDIHDFRAEHFELTDYDPHPAIKGIPVLT